MDDNYRIDKFEKNGKAYYTIKAKLIDAYIIYIGTSYMEKFSFDYDFNYDIEELKNRFNFKLSTDIGLLKLKSNYVFLFSNVEDAKRLVELLDSRHLMAEMSKK